MGRTGRVTEVREPERRGPRLRIVFPLLTPMSGKKEGERRSRPRSLESNVSVSLSKTQHPNVANP